MNRWLCLAAAALACVTCATSAEALEAVCSPDHAEIAAGESTTVRALFDAPAGAPVVVAWSADRGEILPTSDSAVVMWRPGSPQEAPPTITARVTAGAESAMCTARVAVLQSPQRGLEETIVAAGLLLPTGALEPPGYGLYSYVLFPHRPQTDEERERLESVLKSVLLFNGAGAMEKAGVARSHLNAAIVPITQALPDDFDQRDDRIAWLRNHYAFERALKLLLKLQEVAGQRSFSPNGTVWVVSCLHPLGASTDPRPVLVQDLSAMSARSVGIWASRFAAMTTQPRLYESRSIAKLSLDLRIMIAQAGDGVEAVRAAFKQYGSTVLN